MSSWKPACFVIALASTVPAAAQLHSERVEGTERICVYQTVRPDTQNERKVGLGEACPPFYRPMASNFLAPPTARLQSSEVRGHTRVCKYGQLHKSWSFEIPLAERCPISAGMVRRTP